MSKYNIDFLEELNIIAESFARAVVNPKKSSEESNLFEETINKYINDQSPEKQSNLLFLCGMLIVQLSNVDTVEKRSAVATAIIFKKVLDGYLNNTTPGGTMIKALTFPLVFPRLDKDTKNEIVSSHCDC